MSLAINQVDGQRLEILELESRDNFSTVKMKGANEPAQDCVCKKADSPEAHMSLANELCPERTVRT